MPLVSIVTPVHNASKFLKLCLSSVQDQTYPDWEHIIIDDFSTDSSAKIIRQFAESDTRIKYHRLERNSGAGIARNKAIELAQGDYIAFLDSDDKWHPEKLARQIAFMRVNDYHFTFTSYGTMNVSGNPTKKIVRAKKRVTYDSALYKNPIGCLTVIYDVAFFGKQYMPEIRKRQDYALWLRLLKNNDGYGLDEILATYRLSSKSISSNKFNLIKYEWRIYRDIEGLSCLKSSFYLLSAIIIKMKSYILNLA